MHSFPVISFKRLQDARRPALTSSVGADVAIDRIFLLLTMTVGIFLLLMIEVVKIVPFIL